jgi:hypothetical protein
MRPFFSSVAIASAALLCGMAQNPQRTETNPGCPIVRLGVILSCPEGWNILNENEREVVISNFRLAPDVTRDIWFGKGKATIAVSTMPKLYQSLADWIYAGHKNAPESVETRLVVRNTTGSDVPVVCLASPGSTGPAYSRRFQSLGANGSNGGRRSRSNPSLQLGWFSLKWSVGALRWRVCRRGHTTALGSPKHRAAAYP